MSRRIGFVVTTRKWDAISGQINSGHTYLMSIANNNVGWFRILRSGDQTAVEQLWDGFVPSLQSKAETWLGRMVTQTDVGTNGNSHSAFDVFCRGLTEERFDALRGADELWRLLATITLRRQIGNQNGLLAETRDERLAASSESSLENRVAPSSKQSESNSSLALQMAHECRHLLRILADTKLEAIVLAKLEGLTNEAIATDLKLTRRTIQRMIRLIRNIWEGELA